MRAKAVGARATVTGHLVLASLYAPDAASVPRRLLELGLERFWVREALLGAMSQRPLRTLCTECRRERETTAAEGEWLGAAGLDEPAGTVNEPVRCANCRGTGYRGRSVVVEVLAMDDKLGRALMECAELSEFEALARVRLAPMRRHAAEKVVAGLTSVVEASRVLD